MKLAFAKPHALTIIQPHEIYTFPKSPHVSKFTTHKRIYSNQFEETFNFIVSLRGHDCTYNLHPPEQANTPYLKAHRASLRYNLLKQAILKRRGMSTLPIKKKTKFRVFNTFIPSPLPININTTNTVQNYIRASSQDYSKMPRGLYSTCDERKFKKQHRQATPYMKWELSKRPTTHMKMIKTPGRKVNLFPFSTGDRDLDICKWEDSDKECVDFTNEVLNIC